MRRVLRRLAAWLRAPTVAAPDPHPRLTWHDFPRETLHHFDEPLLPTQPFGVAVPSYALRTSAGTGDLALFLGIGEAWAQIVSCFLPPDPVVLDLGCGCGKLARFLHLNPRLQYVGVDIFLPSILWCRRAFAASADRTRFEHIDGHSVTYNPEGTIRTTEISLPLAAESVDAVVCGSLFTHLLEPDAIHYLQEIARVLRPGGGAFISVHVDVPHGERFSGTEDRIDVDEGYFIGLASEAGLSQDLRVGVVYGQVVLLLRKRH